MTINKKYLLCFFILFLVEISFRSSIWAEDEYLKNGASEVSATDSEKIIDKEEGQKEKIIESLDRINNKVFEIKEFIEDFDAKEKSLFDFKIYFSDILTQFSIDGVYRHQFKKSKNELDDFNKDIVEAIESTSVEKEKIEEFKSVLVQTKDSYRHAISQNSQESKVIIALYKKHYKEVKKIIKKLSGYQAKVVSHLQILNGFRSDAKKWTAFLAKKMEKSVDSGLLKWEMPKAFLDPIKSSQKIIQDVVSIYANGNYFSIEKYLQDNGQWEIALKLLLSFIFVLIIWFLISHLSQWLKGQNEDDIDPYLLNVLKILISRPYTLSLLGMMSFTIGDLGAVSLKAPPHILFYLLTAYISALIWLKVGYRIISIFVSEMNKSKKRKKFSFRRMPILLFIFTKSFQNYFEIENDFLVLFNNILLGWVSYKLLYFSLRFKVYSERYSIKSLAVFVEAIKVFIAVFSSALLASVFISIIGFFNLGRTIQMVVTNNLILLAGGWMGYQTINMFLNLNKKSIVTGKSFKEKEAIFLFAKSFFNVFSLGAFILLVAESWYNVVFLFSNFWEISILTLGDHHLYLNRVVRLVSYYYVVRFIYLFVLLLLDSFLLAKLNISKRYSSNVISILRYFFVIIYISLSAAIVGMTYKNLVIFASALGVGIGFGLQSIVNNFISGIILLFERPIRIGDVIEINGIYSRVKHIGIRSTIVECFNNSSVIIPNSDILSNKLVNWTFNNSIMAVHCDVGVAYGSDTELVSQILTDIASKNKDILNAPVPQVWFKEFADSSLNFTLKVWIDKPMDQFLTKSDIMHEMNKQLAKNNITIPFPQRDVHLVNK